MKLIRSLALTFGFICLLIGVLAALSGGGPFQHLVLLGQSLIIGGASLSPAPSSARQSPAGINNDLGWLRPWKVQSS